MSDRLASIRQEILDGMKERANSRAEAFELRKQFLDSKTGKIGQLMKEMKSIAPEDRASFGKSVNELKEWAQQCFAELDVTSTGLAHRRILQWRAGFLSKIPKSRSPSEG